jgi:hypothetical protein
MLRPRRRLLRFALAAPLAALAMAASAATYVPMSDAALVDQSPAVVLGTVVESAAQLADASTLTRVAITTVLKGGALPSPLAVRVPGFVGEDESLLVPGAPRFAAGEEVLLFLAPRTDGTWSIQQFMLGAFHEVERGGERLAVRDLAGASALQPAAGEGAEPARDLARFAGWIRERAQGRRRAADYFFAGAPPALRSAHDDFVLLGTARWQVFDAAGSVAWEFHSAGYDGAGAGVADFTAARGAWNGDPNSTVSYTSAGSTPSTGPGLNAGDGSNRIIFGDPNGEIAGSFNCGTGGVVGIGGYRTSGTHSHNSQTFGSIVEGDIVIQDNTACFFSGNAGSAADVFTHELGHTLGLGHSPDSAAIMFASAQPPYQAVLGADDQAGICFLYGANCPGGGGGGAPTAPSNLAASALSSTQIQLSWNDNSSNETSFRVEMRTGANPFVEIGSVATNAIDANVTSLSPATTYDFRVRARNGSGDSAYTNVASATTLSAGSPPAAPSAFSAATGSSTSLLLQWQDNSNNETSFVIQRQSGFSFVDFSSSPANTAAATLVGLTPNTSYTLRVVARNGAGDSAPSNVSTASTLPTAIAPPNPPSGLLASPAGAGTVHLSWSDNSANEDSFRIESRTGFGAFAEIAGTAANATAFDVTGLPGSTAVDFRVRARNAAGDSAYSNIASATTPLACGGDADTTCLQGGRFAVRITWKTPDGGQGVGHPMQLTPDSAHFWFFRPENIEVVAKVLDGCALSGRFWVFATGLTNVETHITVTDSLTHQSKTYTNPQGQAFLPIQDTGAFATCGAGSAPAIAPAPAPPVPVIEAASDALCSTQPQALCLQGGRFKVEAFWRTPQGQSGQAQAVPLTADSGYFWFFSDSNIELVTKVLDACAFVDRFWVFAGGLTNVEVRLEVTDTATGTVREYLNPLDQPYLPLQDANAFETCP